MALITLCAPDPHMHLLTNQLSPRLQAVAVEKQSFTVRKLRQEVNSGKADAETLKKAEQLLQVRGPLSLNSCPCNFICHATTHAADAHGAGSMVLSCLSLVSQPQSLTQPP